MTESIPSNAQGVSQMNLAKGKPSWGATKTFFSLGTTVKSLKKCKEWKPMPTKNSKTQFRYEIKLKFEVN